MGLLKEERVWPTFIINIISLGCNLFAIGSWPQFYTHKDYFSADWCSLFHRYTVLCHYGHRYVSSTDRGGNQCKLKPRFWELVSFQREPSLSRLCRVNESPCPVVCRLPAPQVRIISINLSLFNSGWEEERETKRGRGGRQLREGTD